MKRILLVVILTFVGSMMMAMPSVQAQDNCGYGYGGYGFGGYGLGYPFYYPPAYAYPPTVVVPTTPPVYIQQQQAQPVQPAQPQTNYWYYCQNPDGYYPYVKNCPGGWLQVAPQPPGQ